MLTFSLAWGTEATAMYVTEKLTEIPWQRTPEAHGLVPRK